MLKSHEKFHSSNGKRLILVVDDEFINRELMGVVLENDFEVIYAENGLDAMALIRENAQTLSLVLLDLMMPVMSGKDVLLQMREDPTLRQIPVIVLTADQNAEIESLSLGAADFIPKPYPKAGVILARVMRTIEFFEDRQIIQSTERDPLTGLYNREYFYSYAEQFDQHHDDMPMDALVVDVNHFRMINERFGTTYGDDVLRRIGQKVRELVSDTGGIVCRREADTFMVYCPHGKDYKELLENASIGLAGDDTADNRVRLRLGVYADVDKTLEIERRFDRAEMAADTVRNSFAKTIGYYDETLHERELYAEQLIEDFPKAIEECQFEVFYQPKFDVRPEIPVLASAEALVRWFHPTLGMISPGVFIPLFEENGLIERLDKYVWRTTAAQIADWKRRLGFSVPVSVNVSRIDMYDPKLIDTFRQILDEHALTPGDLFLEITESAYTQNSEQIIATVNDLRALGFRIEMDDFGTGYSSLNMISSLPIDALKLDMQFIRSAFSGTRDTRMIEVIIDIADYLHVPVIAEGVETAEQLNALRMMGCTLVQGYYFSRPVPAGEYESFVLERMGTDDEEPSETATAEVSQGELGIDNIAYALSAGYDSVYYIDTETNSYVEFGSEGAVTDLQIERSGSDFFADAQRVIMSDVHPADRALMSLCLAKENLVEQLVSGRAFSITYRLVKDGAASYHTLKAVRAATQDDHHVVVGTSNVDEQVRRARDPLEPLFVGGNELDFASLAKALSNDMESIYYVDTVSDTYLEFVTHGSYETLELEVTGTNFFDECARNIQTAVYEDDRERVSAALSKRRLLERLDEHGVFTMDYRLIIAGKPQYYRLKAIPTGEPNARHVIIGVSNIDAQVSDEQRFEAERQSTATFSRIAQALAQDYFSIYYVDLVTDRFIEYSSQGKYQNLSIESCGDDFFAQSQASIRRVVFAHDQSQVSAAFTKENVLNELEKNGSFTLTYRLIIEGEPTFVHLKAIRMADRNDPHIVIGVSNIDAQIKREQEHAMALRSAKEAAYRDSLTGVKSKAAYAEAINAMNATITGGEAGDFAVVICDVNDLKLVNDTQGHAAGDELIRSACRKVCETFAHSPVYRYGGDEFVAILRGQDYECRHELVEHMARENRAHLHDGSAVVACGMAEFHAGTDDSVTSVFRRADAAMYEDKKELKALAGAV